MLIILRLVSCESTRNSFPLRSLKNVITRASLFCSFRSGSFLNVIQGFPNSSKVIETDEVELELDILDVGLLGK